MTRFCELASSITLDSGHGFRRNLVRWTQKEESFKMGYFSIQTERKVWTATGGASPADRDLPASMVPLRTNGGNGERQESIKTTRGQGAEEADARMVLNLHSSMAETREEEREVGGELSLGFALEVI